MIKISLIMLLGLILFMSMDSVTAQEVLERVQDKDIFFSTEEDFIAEMPGAIPIISDGDLLNSGGYVYMRNLELLKQFNVSFDLGLDAADVINITDRIVAFSTELDHPAWLFTAGDLLATNGAILPNAALLAAFHLSRDLDLGLDAVHFKGSQDSVIYFLDVVKKMGRKYWLQNPLMLIRCLKKYGIDIWFSTEGTPPDRRRPRFLDGDLLSAASGTILLSNHDALPITVPAGIPQRGVDFGMDAVTVSRVQPGPIQPRCVDSEDLPLGKEYRLGDVFTDSDVTITVQRFHLSNGQWTSNGFTKVENTGRSGGTGQDMQVNNVNLDFNFGCTCDSLSLLFGEYGGNLNIRINGDFKNFQNFVDIHGATIGGVHVSVSNGLGNDKGKLFLLGKIKSFAIGGQELWIDHVCCYCPSDNGRILFSTEIKGKKPPFTDGDVIRSGNGVVIPHFDLIQKFKPKAKFLGLDALSIVVKIELKAQITHFNQVSVSDINVSGLAYSIQQPFGQWIQIHGYIPIDVDEYRVVYCDAAHWPCTPSQIDGIEVTAAQNWNVKADDGSGGCSANRHWYSDADGWFNAAEYRTLRNCTSDLPLTMWNSATAPNKDGLYIVWLQFRRGGVEFREPFNHYIQLDNTPPQNLAVAPKVGTLCGEFGPTDMPMMVQGHFDDTHFWHYRLVLYGGNPVGIKFYSRINHYDDPMDNVGPTGTGSGMVDLHEINVNDLPAASIDDCAYAVRLDTWDRTIRGYDFDPPNDDRPIWTGGWYSWLPFTFDYTP